MHKCLYLITEKIPDISEIDNILQRFNENNINFDKIYDTLSDEEIIKQYPFTFDYYNIGGRYGGSIKYKLDKDDYKYYNHNIGDKKIKSNFFEKIKKQTMAGLINKFDECDYVLYLGFREGFIYCDGATISQIINIDSLIEQGGGALYDSINNIAISTEIFNGSILLTNEKYKKQVKEIFENNKNSFLTIIDIHF